MNMLLEDFMPRTAEALERLEQAKRHIEHTRKTAGRVICAADQSSTEKLYSECSFWDEKIADAQEVVELVKLDVLRAVMVEGGAYLLIIALMVISMMPLDWI